MTDPIQLRNDFKYIHGAIPQGSPLRIPYSDEITREKDKLIDRIVNTETGGCFLITGYRGVGKTCFVDQISDEINDRKKGSPELFVSLKLNLAKNITPKDLMHQIIRKLYEKFKDDKKIKQANKDYIQQVYCRTVIHLKTSIATQGKEISSKEVTTGGEGKLKGAVFYVLSGEFMTRISKKKATTKEDSSNIAHDLSYLDYDEKAAEDDILQIAKMLRKDEKIKLLIIFDEMDKLTSSEESEQTLDENNAKNKIELLCSVTNILSTLKNVLSESEILFILIAGKDVDDLVEEDMKNEDSFYASIISYKFYLPMDWQICDRILKKYIVNYEKYEVRLNSFKNYLNYSSRGILRQSIFYFNSFIKLDEGVSRYTLKSLQPDDLSKINFFSELQEVIQHNAEEIVKKAVKGPVSLRRRDRLTILIYQIIDKMLKNDEYFSNETLTSLISSDKNSKTTYSIEKRIMPTLLDVFFEELLKTYWFEKVVEDKIEYYRFTEKRRREKASFENRDDISAHLDREKAEKEENAKRLLNEAEQILQHIDKEGTGYDRVPDALEKLKESMEINPNNEKAIELYEKYKAYVSNDDYLTAR